MVHFSLALPAEVRFGAGLVSEVPPALMGIGASRVLVVTGRTTSRVDAVRSALTEAGIHSVVVGVASTLLCLVASTLGAWSLHRMRWPAWVPAVFLGWAMVFNMIPPVALAGAWFC